MSVTELTIWPSGWIFHMLIMIQLDSIHECDRAPNVAQWLDLSHANHDATELKMLPIVSMSVTELKMLPSGWIFHMLITMPQDSIHECYRAHNVAQWLDLSHANHDATG